MIQIKVAAGIAAAAVVAHAAVTTRQRLDKPFGRQLHFSPGSQDEIVANGLKTGDIVLFRRDAASYPLASGLAVFFRQLALNEREKTSSGSSTKQNNSASSAGRTQQPSPAFDHVGVIVMRSGEPYVLETSTWGPVLRPYDARIRCSLCKKVAVRPLAAPLPLPVARSMESFAASIAGKPTNPHVPWVVEPVRDLVRAVTSFIAAAEEDATSPATELVAEAYYTAGILPASGSAAPAPALPTVKLTQAAGPTNESAPSPSHARHQPQLTLQALQQPSSPFPGTSLLLLGNTVWVRDLR